MNALLLLAGLSAVQQPIEAELVTAAIPDPLFVASAPGEPASRLFILAKSGAIRILQDGALLPAPFLDVGPKLTPSGEGGLLGMAFHPGYEQNGYVYLNYTGPAGATFIERYQRDPLDPDRALPGSAFTILTVAQPYSNHNGGWLGFGPDGYLYVPLGDGGSQGDPGNRAQNGQELLGKILRLDVDGGAPYAIPPSNPFVGDPNVRDEIWALGLRNPWRCDFDPLNGDLWIADVGQMLWEELNVQPAGLGGRNYGWRIVEANHCYDPPQGCSSAGLTAPVYEYAHGGFPYRCSIIGGEVYRGREMADMHGRFFFADYCSGEVWSVRRVGAALSDFADHSAPLGFQTIVSMGEDADGEIYVCADFALWKIVPAGLRLRLPPLAAGAGFTAEVGGGAPNAACGLFFSKAGLRSGGGVPGVKLGILSPVLIGMQTTDAAGTASFSAAVPAQLKDRTIWVQAAQATQLSHVVVEIVE